MGLSGQGTLIDPETLSGQKLPIGWNLIALLEADDVSHDNFGGGPSLLALLAEHGDLVGKQLLKRLHRALGPVFLQEAEDAVDHDDGEDRPAQLGESGQKRQSAADPQQHGKERGELGAQPQEQRAAADAVQPIGAAQSAVFWPPRRQSGREGS